MPRIGDDDEMQTQSLGRGFSFSGKLLERLEATEYTLATILVDVTYSTLDFAEDLLQALKVSVLSLKKSPRADNLLVRVVLFSTQVGVSEVHGFKPLSGIDVDAYPKLKPDGATNLFDATWEAVAATAKYGQDLKDNDFLANGIIYVITDGSNNSSIMTADSIKQEVHKIRKEEKLESLLILLIGINDDLCQTELDDFKAKAELDGYKSVKEATPQNLAKLGQFVSKSTSSQSQSIGSGGASKQIAATI